MTQVTVKELAQVVDTPVERLLQQMREAGLSHTSAEQVVTDNEKQALLAHLKSSHGAKVDEPRKITLQRKTTTKLKVGGSKTISVEVRKKKTFVKRSAEEIEAEQRRELEEQRAAEEAARLKAEQEARERAEEEARRQAEAAKAQNCRNGCSGRCRVGVEHRAGAGSGGGGRSCCTCPRAQEGRAAARRKPRSDDDERRDRKHAQHRPSLKTRRRWRVPYVAVKTKPMASVAGAVVARASSRSVTSMGSRAQQDQSCVKCRSARPSLWPNWPSRCR